MVDLNDNITSDTVEEIFSNVGLTEAITHHHRATGTVTMYQIVSHPIDGIYTLINIQISDGGYPPFGIIPSDHHLLWLEIELNTLVPHTMWRLNC